MEEKSPTLYNLYSSCDRSFRCYILLPLASTWEPSEWTFCTYMYLFGSKISITWSSGCSVPLPLNPAEGFGPCRPKDPAGLIGAFSLFFFSMIYVNYGGLFYIFFLRFQIFVSYFFKLRVVFLDFKFFFGCLEIVFRIRISILYNFILWKKVIQLMLSCW